MVPKGQAHWAPCVVIEAAEKVDGEVHAVTVHAKVEVYAVVDVEWLDAQARFSSQLTG